MDREVGGSNPPGRPQSHNLGVSVKAIKFAIPKGSFWDDTCSMLRRAGYELSGVERSYRPKLNDTQIGLKILKPQEIPNLVAQGAHDIGISGKDWIVETSARLVEILNLGYGKVRIVLAVPRSWNRINSLNQLMNTYFEKTLFNTLFGDKALRIATEYLNISSKFIQNNIIYRELFGNSAPMMVTPWWQKGDNISVKIMLSFGATEAKPPEDAEAVIDNVQTGITLERNNLKIIETIMESTAILIANPKAMQNHEKREKINEFLGRLRQGRL